MIITYQEAKKIAVSFLSQIEQEMGISLLIVESHVRENDDGWFFPYQSKEYLETILLLEIGLYLFLKMEEFLLFVDLSPLAKSVSH